VRTLPISESTIGLTLLGIGTSLPELTASLVAALKKNYGIAIGNVIGSNIFDFLMIVGIAAAMKPIRFSPGLMMSLWITALATLILFGSFFIGKRYTIGRLSGAVFIALYAGYLYFLIAF
jgi:cation:H+ antiporter